MTIANITDEIEIEKIEKIEMKPLVDIGVEDVNEFVLSNGVVTHNSMYAKTIMGGGQGPLLAADQVFFISKSKNKEGSELDGYNFTLRAHKSRFVFEESRLPVTVSFKTGIDRSSGLLELGIGLGCIEKVGHRYKKLLVDNETGEIIDDDDIRFKKDIDFDWFKPLLDPKQSDFTKKASDAFTLGNSGKLIRDDYDPETSDGVEPLAELDFEAISEEIAEDE